MPWKRKVSGVKIPEKYILNDEDDATTGQLIISKAGTTALAVSGSGARAGFTGTGFQMYIANDTGTVGTLVAEGISVRYYIGTAGTGTFV